MLVGPGGREVLTGNFTRFLFLTNIIIPSTQDLGGALALGQATCPVPPHYSAHIT